MIALSFSRFKDTQCPYRFNALHIAKTYKEPPNDAMLTGGELADILKAYRLHCFESGIGRDLDYLWKIHEDRKSVLTNPERCAELLANFAKSDFAEIPVTALCVLIERKLAFDEHLHLIPDERKPDDGWFSKKAAFRLISDSVWRVGDTLQIIDEKTGFGEPDPLQLEIAAYLLPRAIPATDLAGVHYVSGSFNILSSGKRVDVFTKTMPETMSMGDLIKARLAEVNSWTEFPAKACGACAYCSIPTCPLKEEAKELIVRDKASPVLDIPKEIKLRSDAEMAVKFISFAESVVDRVKDMLREFVEQKGPVSAGGLIAELRPNDPWKAGDVAQILSALVAYGVDKKLIFDNIGLSESALEKIVKKAGVVDRLPLLLSMGERKAYKPKFGLYKDKI